MTHANLCLRYEIPCWSCWIKEGNFEFVELFNAEYANKYLNLKEILFHYATIKVDRPKKYFGPFVVMKT